MTDSNFLVPVLTLEFGTLMRMLRLKVTQLHNITFVAETLKIELQNKSGALLPQATLLFTTPQGPRTQQNEFLHTSTLGGTYEFVERQFVKGQLVAGLSVT